MNVKIGHPGRIKLSHLVGFLLIASFIFVPNAYAEDSNQGDVVVRKNSDGSITTYDSNDPAVNNSPAPASTGDREIIWGVHGKNKPYTRKHSDGVTVRRNADGSIETFTPAETHPINFAPRSTKRKRTYKKRRRTKSRKKVRRKTTSKAKKTTTKTSKKSYKAPPKRVKKSTTFKRGSLLK